MLSKEERVALRSANTREKQAVDGKRLVSERKQDLERLEKKIFQGGKLASRPDGNADDGADSPTDQDPAKLITDTFEKLKVTTGIAI